jgi:hypothetical protein
VITLASMFSETIQNVWSLLTNMPLNLYSRCLLSFLKASSEVLTF